MNALPDKESVRQFLQQNQQSEDPYYLAIIDKET